MFHKYLVHSFHAQNVFIYGCDSKYFDAAENHPSRYLPKPWNANALCAPGASKLDSHALFLRMYGMTWVLTVLCLPGKFPSKMRAGSFPPCLAISAACSIFRWVYVLSGICPIKTKCERHLHAWLASAPDRSETRPTPCDEIQIVIIPPSLVT